MKIGELTQVTKDNAEKGQQVVYLPSHLDENETDITDHGAEFGFVQRVGETMVFVRFWRSRKVGDEFSSYPASVAFAMKRLWFYQSVDPSIIEDSFKILSVVER